MVESRRHDPRDARRRIEERVHAGVRGEGPRLSAPDRDVVRERQHDRRRRRASLGAGRTKGRGLHIVGVDQRHDLADDRQCSRSRWRPRSTPVSRSPATTPAQKVSATFSSVAVTPATTTPPTNQPPTVAITAPASGSTVSGSVAVRGTASDDAGVAKVEVRVDAGAYALATGTTSWTDDAEFVVSLRRRAHADRARHRYCRAHHDDLGLCTSSNAPAPGTTAAGSHPGRIPRSASRSGLFEDTGGTWMRNSGARWDARYRYFVQGWLNNWGWSPPDGSWGLGYLHESASQGYMPVVQYYVMNGVSGYNESAFLATAQNAAKMADYFNQWKVLMQRVTRLRPAGGHHGRSRRLRLPAAADRRQPERLRGGRRQRAARAGRACRIRSPAGAWRSSQLRAAVGASNAILGDGHFGLGDRQGSALLQRDRPAPARSRQGLCVPRAARTRGQSDRRDVGPAGEQPARSRFGLLHDVGQNRWWDASDTASISSRSFNRYAEWLRLWNVKAQKRWVLWQIPLGNSNHLNVYNNGGARQGYKDNRPEYFFGANSAAHLQKFANAGVVGLFFGAGRLGHEQLHERHLHRRPAVHEEPGGCVPECRRVSDRLTDALGAAHPGRPGSVASP